MDAIFSVLKLLLLTVIILTINKMLAFGYAGPEDRKCKYSRVEKLMRIRCHDMNLKEVPQYLKSSVEILDLSYNRIRKLQRNSFEPYGSIKYLLLYENMIQFVEPQTFAGLKSVQEIDLSNNALTTIPLEIFQLPSLRNLYVDSNDLINLENDLMHLETPISAPLEYLNIANCGLTNLPNLGILPKLWHINASSNPLRDLEIDRFAYWCHLRDIDLISTSLSECHCQQITSHLNYLSAKTKFMPVCTETLDLNICPLPDNQTINSKNFKDCQTSIQWAEARSMWLFISGCLGGVIAVLLLACYCIYRQRKKRLRKQRRAAHKGSAVVAPKNALYRHKHSTKDFKPNNNFILRDETHQNQELLNCDSI